ncbi:M15 family metallopeptidase [Paenibacillus rhizovicinus]|uniref:M15 family metallopeptidase n=1 Tax=Paenibacillus rhizovicinus TaxID=2704463 RepID=A0A6C0P283_9BACL|nr:M15 family metallopeptidase [Paenibacillus rhizovicinus]QHW32366.1 M15 family metallopeptidase [Paenibacillus rhizovicinus]
MKKIHLAGLVLLVLIVIQVVQHADRGREKVEPMPETKLHSVQAGHNQLYRGNLLLVDQEHPVHEAGRLTDIVNVFEHPELKRGYGLMDTTIALSKRVAEKWQVLVDAAGADGIRHFVINSGYRDEEAQKELYEEKGSDYALPPGYSEHNLGLSMDIGSTEEEMGKAPEGKWLSKNAWKYGFILRYPKNKTDITGIQYEPWHFRYVGLPHSALMHEHNWTLEEYLSALKEQKTMTEAFDGVNYTVTYYPAAASGETAISVPIEGAYTVSGDNADGIIVTAQSGSGQ